jgi:hypothetical protein
VGATFYTTLVLLGRVGSLVAHDIFVPRLGGHWTMMSDVEQSA